MKLFCKKIITFCLPLILYLVAVLGINIYNIYSNQALKLKLKLSRVLIVGDSHVEHAINPAQFSSAQNVGQFAEPYVLTYWKLKKILQSYIPDTIMLGLSPHNISAFNDLKFSKEPWKNTMFKRCYPISKFSDIDDEIAIAYRDFWYIFFQEAGLYPKKDHVHYIGQYSGKEGSHVTNYKKVIERHYSYNGEILGVSTVSINYLDSIVNLAWRNQIALFLVETPLHKNYFSNIPKEIILKYNSLKERYKNNVTIIGALNVDYPDTLFLDADHLNIKGADRFTAELKEQLNQ